MTSPLAGLNVIYARSRNFCIGKNGGLPWSLPLEYQHFENITQGFPLIMGRKSYQDHDGLLPNSLNIIVSSQASLVQEPDAEVTNNLENAIKIATSNSPSFFVIGGATLIDTTISDAVCVYETIVDAEIDGDTFINTPDFSAWHTTELLRQEADISHQYGFVAYQHQR